MEPGGQLWQFGTLVVEPIRKGRGHAADINDRGGAVRARSEDDGTIKDETGSVLLRAPLRKAHSPGESRSTSRTPRDGNWARRASQSTPSGLAARD